MIKRIIILSLVSVLLITSCSIFGLKTISWEFDEEQFLQFSTNKKILQGRLVYSPDPDAGSDSFSTYTISAKKMSGDISAGFGMYFDDQGEENFYLFLISMDGAYAFLKYGDGIPEEIIPWTHSTAVNTGAGEANELRVQRPTASAFEFYINDVQVNTISDESYSGGSRGFALVVGEGEDFPDTPADVRFSSPTLTAPSVINISTPVQPLQLSSPVDRAREYDNED
ncbi:hypothetical protein [Salinispira pacifica]|uniref:Uncharacterized protein n=1 Tax=Salinispira pacifica TaxID=1307761 RepID=V5WJ59_9SPIO|nr:hypothetical protein [Salinispira pacifica]AHC15665.1 hypothetical protein L21SP2_2308 [Salinispira pacifica]